MDLCRFSVLLPHLTSLPNQSLQIIESKPFSIALLTLYCSTKIYGSETIGSVIPVFFSPCLLFLGALTPKVGSSINARNVEESYAL